MKIEAILAALTLTQQKHRVIQQLDMLSQQEQNAQRILADAPVARLRLEAAIRDIDAQMDKDAAPWYMIATDGYVRRARGLLRIVERYCVDPYFLDTAAATVQIAPPDKCPARAAFLSKEIVTACFRRDVIHPGLRAFITQADAAKIRMCLDRIIEENAWVKLVQVAT